MLGLENMAVTALHSTTMVGEGVGIKGTEKKDGRAHEYQHLVRNALGEY